jgi:hypothetical protein
MTTVLTTLDESLHTSLIRCEPTVAVRRMIGEGPSALPLSMT